MEARIGMYIMATNQKHELARRILYVESVSGNEIIVQNTINCRRANSRYKLTAPLETRQWLDVTDMVYAANSCILPCDGEAKFENDVAACYRNNISIDLEQPLYGDEAIGHLCLLAKLREDGDPSQGYVLSSVGRYVVSHSDGYYAVFDGYCDSAKGHTLQIFNPGNMRLFDAKEIVAKCNSEYLSDVQLSESYSGKLLSLVTKSTDSGDIGPAIGYEEFDTMRLA